MGWFIELIEELIFGAKPQSQINKPNLLLPNRKLAKELKHKNSSVFIGKVGRKSLYADSSDRATVIGPPGTGKTTFLINQIFRWIETQNSFVCLDIKPEIYELTANKLKQAGYKCIIYNPTSAKHKYDFIGDLNTPETIGEIASAFIGEENGSPVFSETARDLLDALILHIKEPTKKNPNPKPSLSCIYDFITQFDSMKSLLTELGHSNNSECRSIIRTLKIMGENERFLGSVFATFVSNMRFLRYQTIRNSLSTDGFSLDELQNQKVALFLQFEESQKETTSKLFSVMVGHILRYLIVNYSNRPPVLLLLDEIGNAGVINDLTGKLNTIRSRNIPTWMYWQSTEQMQKYGRKSNEGANIILGACDFQMVFRLNDNATAKYFSQRVGTQRVQHRNVGNQSTTTSSTIEPIIEPHELMELDTNQVLCTYKTHKWIGQATPFYKEKY
ncbi:type IV secretory system conjugative DNA transfer family protein [Marinicella rhabdoformis]|uniref:type IV secretory system conjugative DNA transfer family protein n=1 Tax=Marinicella rhabdoformis TaxID=2580566 RepID=UPI0012AED3AB|nr:type IV secretory system conjugative DNA transfer family protein [Marinicella rhabdoformis]